METTPRGAHAPGIWRFEQRIPILLGRSVRVNVYALETTDGLCLLDCGATSGFESLREALRRQFPGRPVQRVYLTHGHFDHAGAGQAFLSEGAEVWAADAERSLTGSGGPVGVPRAFRYPAYEPSHPIEDGHEIALAPGGSLTATATPGHTDGSTSFASPETRVLALGDCVFGPVRGYATTFFLELLTALRQPARERRLHIQTLERLRGQAHEDTLLLPGHGRPALAGPKRATFPRSQRLLKLTLRIKRW